MLTFGYRLKELRKEKGLNQKELADILHVEKSSVSKYETDKAVPDSKVLIKIANLFEVSIDFLLGRVDGKNTSLIEGTYNNNKIEIEIDGKNIKLDEKDLKDIFKKLSSVGFDVSKLIK